MNLIKTHKIANRKKGQVEFGSQPGGKWMFKLGRYIKITRVPGGLEVAERIAEALHKSWLRTDGKKVQNDIERIDGICRGVMDRLLRMPSLADHKPINASWDNPNTPATGQDVVMVSPKRRAKDTLSWHLPPKGISAEDLEAPKLPVVAGEPEVAAK
jgi:hypothetical protein